MKLEKFRRYPLSLALVTMPLLLAQSRAEEPAPPQIEEAVETAAGAVETDPMVEEVDARILTARSDLEAAMKAAEVATGEEKAKADEEVMRARESLGNIMREQEGAGGQRRMRPEREVASDGKTDGRIEKPETGEGADKVAEQKGVERIEPAQQTDKVEAVENGKKAKGPAKTTADEPDVAVDNGEAAVAGGAGEMAEARPDAAAEGEPEVAEKVAKEADMEVENTERDLEKKLESRKLGLKDKGEAQKLIRELIGKDSELSRAEASREFRVQPRLRGSDGTRGAENIGELAAASAFLLRQLEGKAAREEPPAFFRRQEFDGHERGNAASLREERGGAADVRVARTPRYFHEGRRYVRFDSRNSVPAILLASEALDRVEVQPARGVDRFFQDAEIQKQYVNGLPPQEYRGDDAVVVSYPVSENSMISSNDIIFAQGSTRFADAHSYEMVMALGEAMTNPALGDARFIIEGHASAEGSYPENMRLSQRRAEAIVRDLVREGVDPDRLIPVGYGESEARHGEDAPDRLRMLDRNVMVFRAGGEN